jgi:hypothetical protein
MRDRQTPDGGEGDDGRASQARLAAQWRHRFILPQPASGLEDWATADGWAYADWPALAPTLERLRACADAGAIGAAIDAIYTVEDHNRRFWREAQKPIRPDLRELLNIGAMLPSSPTWAIIVLAKHAARDSNLKRHRTNIVHRLRFWAVAALASVRDAARDERGETEGVASLREQLVDAGGAVGQERILAKEAYRRFTPELLSGAKYYTVISSILNGTTLVPSDDPDVPGDPDTIRSSFRLVGREFDAGRAAKFYLPSDAALRALEWPELAGWPAEIDRRIGARFARAP